MRLEREAFAVPRDLTVMRYIAARMESMLYFFAYILDSAQKSFASIFMLGIKAYSCMSFVDRVLSKSYIKAATVFFSLIFLLLASYFSIFYPFVSI